MGSRFESRSVSDSESTPYLLSCIWVKNLEHMQWMAGPRGRQYSLRERPLPQVEWEVGIRAGLDAWVCACNWVTCMSIGTDTSHQQEEFRGVCVSGQTERTNYARHLWTYVQVTCWLVLQLLTVILSVLFLSFLSQPKPQHRGESWCTTYLIGRLGKVMFLTQEDYLVVFLSDRGDS